MADIRSKNHFFDLDNIEPLNEIYYVGNALPLCSIDAIFERKEKNVSIYVFNWISENNSP